MKEYLASITDLLQTKLGEIDRNMGSLSVERLSVEIIRSIIMEVSVFMQKHPFLSLEEEIIYNKQLAPLLYSKLLIHLKRLEFEKKKLTGSVEKIREFASQELESISSFLEKHDDFCYRYFTNDDSDDTEWYTARGWEKAYRADPALVFSIDKSPGLVWLTQILAYKELRGYWMECLAALESGGLDADQGMQLEWTDSKIDWIELIEALHLRGSFNHGKAPLTLIAKKLSKSMHVEYRGQQELYSGLQDIGMRKKKVAKYVGNLNERLLAKYGPGLDEM